MKKYVSCGVLTGLINGFFGGGGGALLVPLLISWGKIPPREAFASSVAIVLPLCLWSSFLYWQQGLLDLSLTLPYALGGAIGGVLGGKLFSKASPTPLKQGFSLLLMVAGLRSIFS